MNSRNAFSEDLLSAYLDGELPSEERRRVEDALGRDAGLRGKLDSLRELESELRLLPHYRLSDKTAARIRERTDRVGQLSDQAMQSVEYANELIGAYLDNELDEDHRLAAEKTLAASEPHRQLLGDLQNLQAEFNTLPRYRLDDQFADRVLREAERQTAGDPQSAVDTVVSPQRSDRGYVRGIVWAALTTAAAMLLYVGLPDGRDDPSVVIGPPVTGGGAAVDPVVPGTGETQPVRVESENLQFVRGLMESTRREYVLVYDLRFTPEAVENATFARLLKQHGIGFRATLPIDPNDQDDLLRCQFLEGIRVVDQLERGEDEVQLFLVSCKAEVIDDIDREIMSRPMGIKAFAFNLTTRDAGDRVMGRLCDATNTKSTPNQAVELLAGLAMFSGAARNVSSFGAIGVDPSLIFPKTSADDAVPQNHEPAPLTITSSDFQVDVLFVVRNMGPLDESRL